jgi:nicotinamide riboside transporter PnuC
MTNIKGFIDAYGLALLLLLVCAILLQFICRKNFKHLTLLLFVISIIGITILLILPYKNLYIVFVGTLVVSINRFRNEKVLKKESERR